MTTIYSIMFAVDGINILSGDNIDTLFAQVLPSVPYKTYHDYAFARLSLRLYLERIKDEIEKEIDCKDARNITSNEEDFLKQMLRNIYLSRFDERLDILADLSERIFYDEQMRINVSDETQLNAKYLSCLLARHKIESENYCTPKVIIEGVLNQDGLKYPPEKVKQMQEIFAQEQREKQEQRDAQVEEVKPEHQIVNEEQDEEQLDEDDETEDEQVEVIRTRRSNYPPIETEDDFLATDDEREEDAEQRLSRTNTQIIQSVGNTTIHPNTQVMQSIIQSEQNSVQILTNTSVEPRRADDTVRSINHSSSISEQRHIQIKEAMRRYRKRKTLASKNQEIPTSFRLKHNKYGTKEERQKAKKEACARYRAKKKR